jgi:hypothetical protein
MKAPEMTPELQNELDILKMRGVVDPTRFYKRADLTAPPKYFQVMSLLASYLLFVLDCIYFKNELLPTNLNETHFESKIVFCSLPKFLFRHYIEITIKILLNPK